jgi:hypothetical protein
MEETSSCVQQAGELCRDLNERINHLHGIADLIYSHWLDQI